MPWLPSFRVHTLSVTEEAGDAMNDGDVAEYFMSVCDDPSYAVVLLDCGPRERDVVRAVREVTGLSLWHSKVLMRRAPVAVLEDRPQDLADDAVAILRSVGARAEARQEPESVRPVVVIGPCRVASDGPETAR
ncbi:ribosomal protein L7/L12 [Streptomyces sp. NPDC127166]|uniref:ribosomal protein L7/L12 n=1 Tax=Streptomyces sp. NPDC127166 TaxID=3345380 RepID=UPI003637A19A